MSFIEARGVEFSYSPDEEKVINGIDLKIEKGSYVAILGHNGSGKSTLAKILNALVLADQGSVVVDGLTTADKKRRGASAFCKSTPVKECVVQNKNLRKLV